MSNVVAFPKVKFDKNEVVIATHAAQALIDAVDHFMLEDNSDTAREAMRKASTEAQMAIIPLVVQCGKVGG